MSNTKNNISFFLGANSAGGFVSLYDTWIDQKNTQAFYVIKGGAGCGKSTLMKTVAHHLLNMGYEVEYIFCSGDPDSLDGIRTSSNGPSLPRRYRTLRRFGCWV